MKQFVGRTFRVVSAFVCMHMFSVSAYAQEAVEALETGMTFRQLMYAGGWVMAVIGLLSVIILALGGICFFLIRRESHVREETTRLLMDHIINNRFRDAFRLCQDSTTALCKVLYPAFKKMQLYTDKKVNVGKESLEILFIMENLKKAVESVGAREADKMRSLIVWFSNIGVVAPMLGLLGTVLGMIRAFGAIAYKVETGKPVLLSSAISQAMVTTAGGLIVGIVAMMFYYYFTAKADVIVNTLEKTADDVIDEIEHQLRAKAGRA